MANKDGMSDREAAIDALTRFVVSLDDGDAELLTSSLTEDVIMDLTPFSKAGFDFQPLVGRETVVPKMMAVVGTVMDTTHHISNFRVTLDRDVAELSCYVLAQHFRKGQGPSDAFQDFYLMGNRYKGSVVRAEEGLWRIKSLTIEPAWTQGNINVIKVG